MAVAESDGMNILSSLDSGCATYPKGYFCQARGFRIQKLPGRGNGCLATHNISSGELLLAERALAATHEGLHRLVLRSIGVAQPPLEENAALGLRRGLGLKRGITGKDGKIAQVRSLKKGQETDLAALFGVLNVNSYPGGLYPLLAHQNHSCDPNCTVYVPAGAPRNVMVVRAIRDISVGEELTTCYTGDLCGPERRRYLKDNYGFECACTVCASTTRTGKIAKAAKEQKEARAKRSRSPSANVLKWKTVKRRPLAQKVRA